MTSYAGLISFLGCLSWCALWNFLSAIKKRSRQRKRIAALSQVEAGRSPRRDLNLDLFPRRLVSMRDRTHGRREPSSKLGNTG